MGIYLNLLLNLHHLDVLMQFPSVSRKFHLQCTIISIFTIQVSAVQVSYIQVSSIQVAASTGLSPYRSQLYRSQPYRSQPVQVSAVQVSALTGLSHTGFSPELSNRKEGCNIFKILGSLGPYFSFTIKVQR